MKGQLAYRILTTLVGIFGVLLAILLFISIFAVLANPSIFFEAFLMLTVVLYAWFANKFYKNVIVQKQTYTKRQKDWLLVNAIPASLFAALGIVNSIYLLLNPHSFDDAIKQTLSAAGNTISPADLTNAIINIAMFLLVLCSALLFQIVWTIILLKKKNN